MASTQFLSKKLFEKTEHIKISYKGIAHKFQVTERSAKNYIKRDLISGWIVRKKNKYTHPIFHRLCDGKNTYLLTEKGRGVLRGKTFPKSPPPPSNNKESLQLLLELSYQLPAKPLATSTLKKYGCFPRWWFQVPTLLHKTLKLLFQKIKKGYRLRNPIGWISAALRDQGCGYRKKIAQEILNVLNRNTVDPSFSEPIRLFYLRLKRYIKLGLDSSLPFLMKLLRKGFSHLGSALCALEKVQNYIPNIHHLSAFLSYLVFLEDPHSVYRKKIISSKTLIETVKTTLSLKKNHLRFVNHSDQLPATPEPQQTYLQFLIHKRDPIKSLLKTYQFIAGKWKEHTISIRDPQFIQKMHACMS